MKYICVQPKIAYYIWQVEVMINNFLKNGISGNDIEILLATSSTDTGNWDELINKFNYVRFFTYEDLREDKSYIPSVYFNIIKQHFLAFPELEQQSVFCHDCDIIFTRPLDFSSMLNDNIWYMSDTVGYIGTQYILTKGENTYKGMCNIVGIDPLIPKLMNSNSGGAQHLIKNATYQYWDKVEKDSIKLYKFFCEEEKNHTGEDYPIQKWTAGMWSLLWNAWLLGHETKVDKRLDFCWATDSISRWDECAIFHNAGVLEEQKHLFFKGDYIHNSPKNLSISNFSDRFCSYNYVRELKEYIYSNNTNNG